MAEKKSVAPKKRVSKTGAATKKKVTKKATTKTASKAKKKTTKRVYIDLGLHLMENLEKARASNKLESFLIKPDKYGYTPLMYAALYGDLHAAKAMLAAGQELFVDPHDYATKFLLVPDTIRGWTALHCAAVHGNKEIVTLLFDQSVAVAKKDNPLLYELLVCRDTRNGWNPLMFAVNRADYGMIALLLRAYKKYITEEQLKALLEHRDERGEPVISYATRDDVRTLLKSYGA